jgi:hypothetical protein
MASPRCGQIHSGFAVWHVPASDDLHAAGTELQVTATEHVGELSWRHRLDVAQVDTMAGHGRKQRFE